MCIVDLTYNIKYAVNELVLLLWYIQSMSISFVCPEFFTDSQLPSKLDKLMDERQQLLRMNDIIKQL